MKAKNVLLLSSTFLIAILCFSSFHLIKKCEKQTKILRDHYSILNQRIVQSLALNRNNLNNTTFSIATIYNSEYIEKPIVNLENIFIVYMSDHQCQSCILDALNVLKTLTKEIPASKLMILGDFLESKLFFGLLRENNLLEYGYILKPLKINHQLSEFTIPLLFRIDESRIIKEIYFLDSFFPIDYYKLIIRIN